MNTYQLILKRRTIRKFVQRKIKKSDLFACVNAARLAPSSANLQPLEFILITKNLQRVFENTNWAGYLKNGAPKTGHRPVAYIVIVSDRRINKDAKYDVGLAIENIVLTALEKGIASCIIGALNRGQLSENLGIPKEYTLELTIALGYPAQTSVVEEFKRDIKYWLDEKGDLHVPKRKLQEILHLERF